MKFFCISIIIFIMSISCIVTPNGENSPESSDQNSTEIQITPEVTLETPEPETPEPSNNAQLIVSFVFGTELEPTIYKNIYASWIADMDGNSIQQLTICRYLIDTQGKDTYKALPYWRQNALATSNQEQIDAVTSATHQSEDFNFTAFYKTPHISHFIIYFEMDRFRESNDWFADQPAVLYAAKVNLNNPEEIYYLKPAGWTPNIDNVKLIDNSPVGEFQSELRYITNFRDGSGFGDLDERAATTMVKSISLKVIKN